MLCTCAKATTATAAPTLAAAGAAVSTALTAPVVAGATQLQVASIADFAVGDDVLIADASNSETNKILSEDSSPSLLRIFVKNKLQRSGSIILRSPLKHSYSAAATLTKQDCEDGTCTIADDPHINVFDGKQISLLQGHGKLDTGAVQMLKRFIKDGETGDMWVVKSDKVSIQARYARDDSLAEENLFVRSIAVGGRFMNGSKLIIGPLDGWVSYNGQPILNSTPSKFHVSGLINATRHANSTLVQNPHSSNPGIDMELPDGVKLVINRQPHYINVQITMKPVKGGQDGLCGNFNGDPDDDDLELIEARNPRIAEGASLFTHDDFPRSLK